MLILRLWNYIRGYVIIKIEGLSLEKFINACVQKDIYLWEIKRINYTTLEAKVGIKGFRVVKRLSRKCGCRVSISRKNGYPFWAHKVKKRKMLLIGAFFSCILLMIASSFIYSVDVVGNERVSKEEIIAALEEIGLKAGANKYLVDIREIENRLLIELHELEWVGVELSGIYARVEVVEKVPVPERVEKDIPCDIVSVKNGVIEKVIARSGDAVVEKGDIVSKGDLLVTGVIQRDNIPNPLYVHSYGEVYAKTYYETTKSMTTVDVRQEKTGEVKKRYMLRIGSMELSIGGGEIPFENYVIEKSVKSPFFWRNKDFPVEIIVETYFEANETHINLDIEELKKKLHSDSVAELMAEIPSEAEILNSTIDFYQVDDIIYGNMIIEVLEDIGEQRKIDL